MGSPPRRVQAAAANQTDSANKASNGTAIRRVRIPHYIRRDAIFVMAPLSWRHQRQRYLGILSAIIEAWALPAASICESSAVLPRLPLSGASSLAASVGGMGNSSSGTPAVAWIAEPRLRLAGENCPCGLPPAHLRQQRAPCVRAEAPNLGPQHAFRSWCGGLGYLLPGGHCVRSARQSFLRNAQALFRGPSMFWSRRYCVRSTRCVLARDL